VLALDSGGMPHRFAVWCTSSRYSHGYSYLSAFSAAHDARWPSPQADLANMAVVSDPTKTSGKAELCDHERSRRMPEVITEVITSRAPATECLHAHAHVGRMSWLYESHPRTPIAFRWCFFSICRAAFRTAFPRVSSWCDTERSDSLLELHAHRWGACMHGVWHMRVSLQNTPFRAIPDSLRSP
jgi:hypothetical protein